MDNRGLSTCVDGSWDCSHREVKPGTACPIIPSSPPLPQFMIQELGLEQLVKLVNLKAPGLQHDAYNLTLNLNYPHLLPRIEQVSSQTLVSDYSHSTCSMDQYIITIFQANQQHRRQPQWLIHLCNKSDWVNLKSTSELTSAIQSDNLILIIDSDIEQIFGRPSNSA